MVSPDYQKWLYKLLGYDFDIEYKLGFANRVADVLSRVPYQSTLLSLSVPQEVHLADIDKELQSDPLLSQIRQALSLGQPIKHGYSLIQGQLYYHNRLVLPPTSKFIPLILHECLTALQRDIQVSSKPSNGPPLPYIGQGRSARFSLM